MNPPSSYRVHDVAAVELTYWKQVQGSNQHSAPRRPINRIPLDPLRKAKKFGNQNKKQRIVKLYSTAVACRGHRGGCGGGREDQTHYCGRYREREPGQRSGDPYVKQSASGPDRFLDLDHRAECPEQSNSWRRGNKEGQCCTNTVMPAGELVTQLVRTQDHQQRKSKE